MADFCDLTNRKVMQEIAPQVYHLPLMPRNAINCFVVDGILVDAGIRSSKRRLLRALRTLPVHAHLLTHAHADHQGSTAAVCRELGLPLWTSPWEQANAESGRVVYQYPNARHLVARLQQRYWAGPGHPVARTLHEGEAVGSFTVIDTPGHSQGHISLYRAEDGVLIAGDALVHMNLLTTAVGLALPPGLFTTDMARALASVKKLQQLRPRIMAFGHGPVLYDAAPQLDRLVEKIEQKRSTSKVQV